MPVQREREEATMLADYIRLQYPKVMFRYDLAADMKLTPAQAARNKRLNPYRGYPDLFIAEPRGNWHGLYIELKAMGTTVVLKNGKLAAGEHLKEQWTVLKSLELRGYKASFRIGYEEAKREIDAYMRLPKLHA